MTKKSKPVEIDFNAEFQCALDMMEETDKNIFITGRAGTGKSTLLNYFRDNTKKNAVILAPTGVAAVNVGGQTIHSFFHFKPNVTVAAIKRKKATGKEKTSIYKKLKTIIIDEVSMVRADLLDCVDKFLRLNGSDSKRPFGGVQMIFIGDFYQLPPVVSSAEREIFRSHYASPFFFSAKVFPHLELEFIELEKVYRQKDEEFVRLLNTIRNNSITDEDIALFNKRCNPSFEVSADEFYISLTSTNDMSDLINENRLARLPGKIWRAQGLVDGEFGKESMPTAEELKLKKGAQIMLLNNDSYGQWINGTIGKVKKFAKDDEGEDVIVAELDNGEMVQISPYTWKIYKFFLKNEELRSEEVGSFRQYPVRLAFAVTPEDLRKFLSVIRDTRDRAVIMVLLRTGMRIGELLSTKVTDVHIKEKRIEIYEGEKNRLGRVVYLGADALSALRKWQDAVGEHDVIINLAGASIFSRWTPEQKKILRESRIETTRNLVSALPADAGRITLFSTSAVGYYGFYEDEELTENMPAGDDFLAKLADDWEKEALNAQAKGTRVVITRFGIVLGKNGGALVSCQRYSVISKESSRLRNLRFLPAVEMTILD